MRGFSRRRRRRGARHRPRSGSGHRAEAVAEQGYRAAVALAREVDRVGCRGEFIERPASSVSAAAASPRKSKLSELRAWAASWMAIARIRRCESRADEQSDCRCLVADVPQPPL